MFDYKLLEAFAVTIDEGGFEKAARILHLTQSAVSQRIKLLEENHGQVLLTRTSPPVPTEMGQKLLSHYRRVDNLEQALTCESDHLATTPVTFSIGINADSLATWFLPAIEDFIKKNLILLDLHVNDQEETFSLLKQGQVWGCISTREKTAHGCSITHLGTMQYSLCCTPDFQNKWFPEGVTKEAIEQAPIVRFNHSDKLNEVFFSDLFEKNSLALSEFFVPSSETFFECVRRGLSCGIIPHQQCSDYIADGRLVDCIPSLTLPVRLYWHCWSIKTKLMEAFSRCLVNNGHHIF